MLREFKKYLPQIKWKKKISEEKIHEAGLLNLNSNKTFKRLKWKNILNFEETIKMTAEWYSSYLQNQNINKTTINQLKIYKNKLNKKNLMKVVILAGGLVLDYLSTLRLFLNQW